MEEQKLSAKIKTIDINYFSVLLSLECKISWMSSRVFPLVSGVVKKKTSVPIIKKQHTSKKLYKYRKFNTFTGTLI